MERRVLYIMYVMMFALCAASCSEGVDVVDRYVDVEISTTIEGEYASRAEGGFEVDDDIYNMRYTIELWSNSEVIYRAEDIVADISKSLTHSFRAVAGDYQLVIFADYVTADDSYYDTSEGLDEITITENSYTANDPSRDCYGYSEELIITSSFSLSDITLKRPMAKMTLADVEPTNVTEGKSVDITYNRSIPYGYNLLNGEVITSKEVTVSYPTTKANQTIAFDYIFVAEPTNYLMTFKVGDKEVSATINFEQNKTTNITATFFETITE
ncbi:MAG: DUF6562 domain-containing protein [Rikenellaceae bacterium]